LKVTHQDGHLEIFPQNQRRKQSRLADNSWSVYIESNMNKLPLHSRAGVLRFSALVMLTVLILLTACKPNEIEGLQQQVWKNPQDAKASLLLGKAYARNQRYTEASESFKKSLAINPELDEAIHSLGAIAFNQKKYREAVTYFQQHLERSPKDSLRLYNLGNAYMQLKQFDKASALYNESIDNSESFMDAHYNLAVCYINTGHRKEAQAIYEWLLQKNNYLAVSLQKHLNKEGQ
jgi:tetratricopeptide (TPR) repeat protein